MADQAFEDARLAALYDPLDPDRRDLLAYAGIVAEFRAGSVLDIGCGTGTFASLLAQCGLSVTGLDPAHASLEIARRKPRADQVTWVHGVVGDLPRLQVDLVTMTANVAQVFLTEKEWLQVLQSAYASLKPCGRVVFETRNPARRAWEQWTAQRTLVSLDSSAQKSTTWTEAVEFSEPLLRFKQVTILGTGERLESASTLRFRSREEIESSLRETGFEQVEVREAPDRPGLEWVFIAQRPAQPGAV